MNFGKLFSKLTGKSKKDQPNNASAPPANNGKQDAAKPDDTTAKPGD
jgi:hypothetical protein